MPIFRAVGRSLLPLALSCSVSTFARADAPDHTGAIKGKVSDSSGAALIGARVALLTESNTELRRTVVDASGEFAFESLPAGSYLLIANEPGFLRVSRAVRILANQVIFEELQLDVAALQESVTITPARGEA